MIAQLLLLAQAMVAPGAVTPPPAPRAAVVDCAGQARHNYGPCDGWQRVADAWQSPGGDSAAAAESGAAAAAGPGPGPGSAPGDGADCR